MIYIHFITWLWCEIFHIDLQLVMYHLNFRNLSLFQSLSMLVILWVDKCTCQGEASPPAKRRLLTVSALACWDASDKPWGCLGNKDISNSSKIQLLFHVRFYISYSTSNPSKLPVSAFPLTSAALGMATQDKTRPAAELPMANCTHVLSNRHG